MMNVKQAVDAAISYVQEFADLVPSEGVRLEDTDYDDRTNEWYITLSFVENEFTGHRLAKLFRVDGETGVVKFVKTRSPFANVP